MVIVRDISEYGELVLRTGAAGYEIIVDGQFLMSSASGGSATALVELGMAEISGTDNLKVLIAGLGLGFSVRAALRYEAVTEVTVVELVPAIIEWHYRDLIPGTSQMLTDSRVRVVNQDFIAYIERCADQFDLIAVDIDNGPDWLSHEANAKLYTAGYTGIIKKRLTSKGVVTFWSANPVPEFKTLMSRFFDTVSERIYNDSNGEGRLIPAFIYIAKNGA